MKKSVLFCLVISLLMSCLTTNTRVNRSVSKDATFYIGGDELNLSAAIQSEIMERGYSVKQVNDIEDISTTGENIIIDLDYRYYSDSVQYVATSLKIKLTDQSSGDIIATATSSGDSSNSAETTAVILINQILDGLQ